MHRWIDIGEVPLVRRQLPVRVQIAASQQQIELVLGEADVHDRERHRLKGQVPRREPGILPLVGHRDDVFGDQVPPVMVAPSRVGTERVRAVTRQPRLHVVAEVLLGPQHPGQRLARNHPLVLAQVTGQDVGVELVRLAATLAHHLIEVTERAR